MAYRLPYMFQKVTVQRMTSWRPLPVVSRMLRDEGESGPRVSWELEQGGGVGVDYNDEIGWSAYPQPGPPFLPERFHVRLDLPDVPYGLDVDVVVDDGRPRLERLSVDPVRRLSVSVKVGSAAPKWRVSQTTTELSALGLRAVGPQAVLRYAVAAALHLAPAPGAVLPDHAALSLDEFDDALSQREEAAPRKRYQLSEEHLAEVARIYNAAVKAGKHNPVDQVRRRFARDGSPLPRTTASNWIRAARAEHDLLPTRHRTGDGS